MGNRPVFYIADDLRGEETIFIRLGCIGMVGIAGVVPAVDIGFCVEDVHLLGEESVVARVMDCGGELHGVPLTGTPQTRVASSSV